MGSFVDHVSFILFRSDAAREDQPTKSPLVEFRPLLPGILIQRSELGAV
jgi:hypothetical protein